MGEYRISIYIYWLLFVLLVFSSAILFAAHTSDACSVSPTILAASYSHGCFDFWINRYQSLIAGSFALVAALIGFAAIRMQISSSEKVETRRLERESYAARAVLPLALSSICEYAERSTQALLSFRRAQRRGNQSATFERPALPADVMGTLRDCVRTLDTERSKDVARLLSFIQVFAARSMNLGARTSPDQDFLYDAASLYAMASALFEFARYADDEAIGPSGRGIMLALRVMEVPVETYPLLLRRVNEKIQMEDGE